jgi:hypothetical protein
MNATDAELLTRQDALQSEARAVMDDLELLALLLRVGAPVHTGSSALGVMVRRDIDVTTTCPTLDAETIFEVAHPLAAHPRVRRLTWRNDAGHWRTESQYPDGLYWLVEYVSDAGDVWTIDLWFIAEGTTQFDLEHMKTLPGRLDDTKRAAILRIKTAASERPEIQPVSGYSVYEAVLDHGIRTPDEFFQYLERRRTQTPPKGE